MHKIIVEACVDNIESAIQAQDAGADRIELCSALLEGGLTPSFGLIKLVKEKLNIPIHVLIRPRRGDFLYSQNELGIMKEDIKFCQQIGLTGVVFGVLNKDSSLNLKANQELLNYSKNMTTTFHRAFDMLADPFMALEQLIELGFDKILCSGQNSIKKEPEEIVRELVKKAHKRIDIIVAGGINALNVTKIVSQTGVGEVHASARAKSKSKMSQQNFKAEISASYLPNEFEHYSLSPQKLSRICDSLDK